MRQVRAMADLRSTVLESMNRLRSELSPSAQAVLTIPMGIVQERRALFEDRISRHQNERTQVYLALALGNTDKLIRQDRTYAEQLRLIEAIGLRDLPTHLRTFIRDNDNLYRAIGRSRLSHLAIEADPNADVVTRITSRIETVRNLYTLIMIRTTRSQAQIDWIKKHPSILAELHDCTDAVVDELRRDLVREFELYRLVHGDVELENVGPDHEVNDFGSDVAATDPAVSELKGILCKALNLKTDDKLDHTQRCCICLDDYTTHQAVKLFLCNHVIGKDCLSTWLNSTMENSNQCPFCRTALCARRARQPSTRAADLCNVELNAMIARIRVELQLIADIDYLANTIYNGGDKATVGAWIADVNREMNRHFFENHVPLAWRRIPEVRAGWELVTINWATAELLF
jgi:hypothetical protein